jgi:hypothetical protein
MTGLNLSVDFEQSLSVTLSEAKGLSPEEVADYEGRTQYRDEYCQ